MGGTRKNRSHQSGRFTRRFGQSRGGIIPGIQPASDISGAAYTTFISKLQSAEGKKFDKWIYCIENQDILFKEAIEAIKTDYSINIPSGSAIDPSELLQQINAERIPGLGKIVASYICPIINMITLQDLKPENLIALRDDESDLTKINTGNASQKWKQILKEPKDIAALFLFPGRAENMFVKCVADAILHFSSTKQSDYEYIEARNLYGLMMANVWMQTGRPFNDGMWLWNTVDNIAEIHKSFWIDFVMESNNKEVTPILFLKSVNKLGNLAAIVGKIIKQQGTGKTDDENNKDLWVELLNNVAKSTTKDTKKKKNEQIKYIPDTLNLKEINITCDGKTKPQCDLKIYGQYLNTLLQYYFTIYQIHFILHLTAVLRRQMKQEQATPQETGVPTS